MCDQAVAPLVSSLGKYEALRTVIEAATAAQAHELWGAGDLRVLSPDEYHRVLSVRFPDQAAGRAR